MLNRVWRGPDRASTGRVVPPSEHGEKQVRDGLMLEARIDMVGLRAAGIDQRDGGPYLRYAACDVRSSRHILSSKDARGVIGGTRRRSSAEEELWAGKLGP